MPLSLKPSYDIKTWGGRRLELLGKLLPPGKIGESLESGASAVIQGDPFDGVTLGELARTHAAALLGSRGQAAAGSLADFPLLIKLIDAHDDLSVQVHPDDSNAPAGTRGKTEAWHILAADPGARIISGVEGPVQIDRIREQIVETPVAAGEVYLVPAGTVHAIGEGVLLYEIQQASDVTWRLYDWGRPREIHVEAALAVARHDLRATRIEPLQIEEGREMMVACRHFGLERWQVAGERSLPAFHETFRVLTVLDGDMRIDETRLGRGSTTILPADLPDRTLRGSGSILVGYIPDLDADVRQPLRAAGHDVESIRKLGTEL